MKTVCGGMVLPSVTISAGRNQRTSASSSGMPRSAFARLSPGASARLETSMPLPCRAEARACAPASPLSSVR